jgi:hypothetical protein
MSRSCFYRSPARRLPRADVGVSSAREAPGASRRGASERVGARGHPPRGEGERAVPRCRGAEPGQSVSRYSTITPQETPADQARRGPSFKHGCRLRQRRRSQERVPIDLPQRRSPSPDQKRASVRSYRNFPSISSRILVNSSEQIKFYPLFLS